MNDDLISRREVINELNDCAELLRCVLDNVDIVGAEREKYRCELRIIEAIISDVQELPSAVNPELIRCDSCRHDNNCEIQYAAQAGSKFFCGAAERWED